MKSTPKRISFALPMLLIVLAALGLSSTAAAQQIVEDMWTDGAFDGKWSTAGNWTNGVPDNTSGVVYNVTIPASGFNQGPFSTSP